LRTTMPSASRRSRARFRSSMLLGRAKRESLLISSLSTRTPLRAHAAKPAFHHWSSPRASSTPHCSACSFDETYHPAADSFIAPNTRRIYGSDSRP
jgi:hypothetical protein